MAADIPAVVLDCGSDSCRGGLSSDSVPSVIFPTLIGWPKEKSFKDVSGDEFRIGSAVRAQREMLSLRHPIEFNCVTDWEAMEKVWGHMYSQIGVDAAEHPVLVTEPHRNSKINREKLTQVMFESFHVPAFFTAMQPSLSLFAAGRSSGVVLHSGHMTSTAVPIYEGYQLAYARQDAPFGGNNVTGYVKSIIQGLGHEINRQNARDVTEKHCYVAYDFGQEEESFASKTNYSLTSGNIIPICKDIALGPEALFEPVRMGQEFPGLHQYVHSAITACELPQHKKRDMYFNIVLSGGNTLFQGFSARLQKELKLLDPVAKIRVLGCAERDLSPWVGGSMIATSQGFHDMCISRDEYDEQGPPIVHKKCVF